MLLSEETSFLQGVHQKPIVGQQERTDDLNIRLRSRQFPDFPLEPQYDFRPVSTKYQTPAIAAAAPQTPIYMEHNVGMNFNPATRNGPWKTYANNIDTETVLRNYSMGSEPIKRLPFRTAINTIYVPDSGSDLYKDGKTVVYRPSTQPYELLFAKSSFDNTTRWNPLSKIGADRFNNSTRTQLKQAITHS
jgi:hypothetical protein